jgi:hypothetical protein
MKKVLALLAMIAFLFPAISFASNVSVAQDVTIILPSDNSLYLLKASSSFDTFSIAIAPGIILLRHEPRRHGDDYLSRQSQFDEQPQYCNYVRITIVGIAVGTDCRNSHRHALRNLHNALFRQHLF